MIFLDRCESEHNLRWQSFLWSYLLLPYCSWWLLSWWRGCCGYWMLMRTVSVIMLLDHCHMPISLWFSCSCHWHMLHEPWSTRNVSKHPWWGMQVVADQNAHRNDTSEETEHRRKQQRRWCRQNTGDARLGENEFKYCLLSQLVSLLGVRLLRAPAPLSASADPPFCTSHQVRLKPTLSHTQVDATSPTTSDHEFGFDGHITFNRVATLPEASCKHPKKRWPIRSCCPPSCKKSFKYLLIYIFLCKVLRSVSLPWSYFVALATCDKHHIPKLPLGITLEQCKW